MKSIHEFNIMKSLKEQLVKESNNDKVWLLNNGIIIPEDGSLLKYDDEDYIDQTKLLHMFDSSNRFKKILAKSINDFSGSLEVVWTGTTKEYLNQMFN